MPPVQIMVGRVPRTTAFARTLAIASAAAALAVSSTALADDPPAADEGSPAPARPLPRDDRTGHISAFAGLSVVVPGGDLGAGTPPATLGAATGITLAQVAGAGIGGEAGIGVGLTRYSGLDLRGQLVRFEASADCLAARRTALGRAGTSSAPSCSAQMFGVGLGLTYHTAQGLGFDPWVRFGTGYRAIVVAGPLADISATAPKAGTFHGIDVVDLTLGGDFFPTTWFGIGLFLTGVVGIDVSAPSPEARGAVYGLFQAGLRIALEPQRKAVNVASGPPRSGTARAESSVFTPSLYNRPAR